ncbi:hypothetical protein RFI_10122 [Reticulomyxa filosa]|uniref:Crossover junction endonuclease EME1 n=1 Tax=Reticulomyxa filosa TaxID=46433 RepID=X6NMU9_RETFI|nr:hypothetical protein RFI_10122 [Reticulomyxa filosa]|eukprot:ETO27014.1 hypothetical protein RFI_10122 [Reticulomyxa filosa]
MSNGLALWNPSLEGTVRTILEQHENKSSKNQVRTNEDILTDTSNHYCYATSSGKSDSKLTPIKSVKQKAKKQGKAKEYMHIKTNKQLCNFYFKPNSFASKDNQQQKDDQRHKESKSKKKKEDEEIDGNRKEVYVAQVPMKTKDLFYDEPKLLAAFNKFVQLYLKGKYRFNCIRLEISAEISQTNFSFQEMLKKRLSDVDWRGNDDKSTNRVDCEINYHVLPAHRWICWKWPVHLLQSDFDPSKFQLTPIDEKHLRSRTYESLGNVFLPRLLCRGLEEKKKKIQFFFFFVYFFNESFMILLIDKTNFRRYFGNETEDEKLKTLFCELQKLSPGVSRVHLIIQDSRLPGDCRDNKLDPSDAFFAKDKLEKILLKFFLQYDGFVKMTFDFVEIHIFIFTQGNAETTEKVVRYTRCLAEARFNVRSIHLQSLGFEVKRGRQSTHIDIGDEVQKSWCRMLRAIPQVSEQVVQCIVAQYPTCRHLMDCYKTLPSSEAENLLAVEIRITLNKKKNWVCSQTICRNNNAQQKVGQALSKKIYEAFYKNVDDEIQV